MQPTQMTTMGSFTYKLKENTDLCHFCLPSEKEFGIQSIILREQSNLRDITTVHYNLGRSIYENRLGFEPKDLALIQVTTPNKAFEGFDNEKYKIIIAAHAYFKLLEFYDKDWIMVQKRLISDFEDIKSNNEWISLNHSISFRGSADIYYRQTLDVAKTFELNLLASINIDTGKTRVSLAYTNATMGSLTLPEAPMIRLAKDSTYLRSLYDYKEELPSTPAIKKSRPSEKDFK
jgi:hypothetical protein